MSEHLERILEQTATLRAPLEGGAPAGADLALEPEFDAIKAELDKLTSIEGGEVDWRLVVETAEELLGSRTKDLRLAVWLSMGGLERSGWRGFVRGLVVCRSLILDMWESMFPSRAKARANIVVWLGERAAPLIGDLKVTLEDGDDVRLAADLVSEIDSVLADKLGDAFAGIRGLVSATKARVRDIPLPPPPPPEPSSESTGTGGVAWADDDPPAPAEPQPTAARPGVQLSTRAADAEATTRTCGESLVALAGSMASVDPTRAWAYRLHRQGIWLPYERVWIENGVLPSPGPDGDLVEGLRSLAGSARWHELVVASEEASARCPLWLDPHRFAAVALERMGTAFVEAREAVGRETTDFVRRNAFLLEARFADGQPVAGPETVEWLEAEARRWRLGSRAYDVAHDEDRGLAERFAEARDLVASGRHAEGLAIAMQLARRGADPRERFRSSLDVARLAMNAGAPEVARPILEELVAVATAHSLETWDPSLCAKLYAGLYRCLPADAPERVKAFEVLCRLDPGAALRLRGDGTNGHTTRPFTTGGVKPRFATSPEFASPSPVSAAPAPPQPPPVPSAREGTSSEVIEHGTGNVAWADD
jgi:type VI secretion system protein VasJ